MRIAGEEELPVKCGSKILAKWGHESGGEKSVSGGIDAANGGGDIFAEFLLRSDDDCSSGERECEDGYGELSS